MDRSASVAGTVVTSELQSATSASRPLLRFETESFSDSASTAGGNHYGFPDDSQDLSGTAVCPHRLSRNLPHSSNMSDLPETDAFSAQQQQQQQRFDTSAGWAAAAAATDPHVSGGASNMPGTSEITAAPPVAASFAAAAGVADQPQQQPLGRKYHNLWRVRASGAGASAPNLLSEPLVHGQLHVRTARSEAGSDIDSVQFGLRSRVHSHRALTDAEHKDVSKKWAALHMLFVAWLCASLVTVVASWWWFSLGVLVGGSGVLGGISALRHKPDRTDLVQPARGVQWLGVMTGLLSSVAAAIVVISEFSISCQHVDQCVRLRLMLAFWAGWLIFEACLSAFAAHYASTIIQRLQPTVYMRQSEVAVPEADTSGLVTLREETYTPRAVSQTLDV